jgi:uncharacterized membrane protein
LVEQEESISPSGRIKVRIESLSDLVFGLALSIGSIGFLSSPPKSAFELAKNVAFFGFSFVILVFTWLGYSRTIAVLSKEKESTLFLNILLLFLVAIEPYLFFILVTVPSNVPNSDYLANIYSTAYALDVGGMYLIQAALARQVLLESKDAEKQYPKNVVLQRFRGIMIAEIAIGLAFLISSLPFFWIETPISEVRFIFWYSSFAIFFVIRAGNRPKKQDLGDQNKSADTSMVQQPK